MFCTKCGKVIADNALICPNCNDRVAMRNQTAVVESLKEEQRSMVSSLFKSGAFLACAIAMTFVLAVQVISMLVSLVLVIDTEGDMLALFSFLTDSGYVIPAIFGTIGCWKLFSHQTGRFYASMIGSAKVWATFQRILLIILRIVLIVVFAIALTISTVTVLEAGGDAEDFFYTVFVGGGVGAAVVAFVFYCASVYEKICDYYTKLAAVHTTGESYRGAPAASLGILAGLLFTVGVIYLMLYEEWGLSPMYFVGSLSASAYLIVHIVFFQYCEGKQKEKTVAYSAAYAQLESITAKTNLIISEAKKVERMEAYKQEQALKAQQEEIAKAEAKVKEEEAKAAKAQQDMMQQMMMALLQQNMANANANAAAAKANTTPAIDPNMMAALMAQMAQNNAAATPAQEVAPTEKKD